MAKLWTGVTDGVTSKIADEFNSSISFDQRLYKHDIQGSMAHAAMLAECNIISQAEADAIIDGLAGILADLEAGKLQIDLTAEDIHMFVEQELTNRIGAAGKKLHTARSRNDQVALDERLYYRDEIKDIIAKLKHFASVICDSAEKYSDAIMPGYTHLQRAQPITFGHHLMAYAMMLLRDIDRLNDCTKRLNVSPIGSCALAGTTYETNRHFEAEKLGFSSACYNSIDGVSDRDFALELLSTLSIIMMHLSRFAEEVILWSSHEFAFISLSSLYTTGSSIMPQKKNPDMAELVRGKTGRVYGDLFTLLTVLKGLPLAYNKDMQEDKECVFDAIDNVKMCIDVFIGMIETMSVNTKNMRQAASMGFINATDLADYLVTKGLPFRDAYKISGQIVNDCTQNNFVLEDYPIEKYKQYSDKIEQDVYDFINLETCVNKRKSFGGAATTKTQLEFVRAQLKD